MWLAIHARRPLTPPKNGPRTKARAAAPFRQMDPTMADAAPAPPRRQRKRLPAQNDDPCTSCGKCQPAVRFDRFKNGNRFKKCTACTPAKPAQKRTKLAPPIALQRDGNGNEVVVVDDSDNEVASVQPAVAATSTSPADALALVGIKPYGAALVQMREAATNELNDAKTEANRLGAQVQDLQRKIATDEATVEHLKDVIGRTYSYLNNTVERQKKAAEAKRDECRDERRRLDGMTVPPPGPYLSFVPGTGISQGVELCAKIEEIASDRAAGGGFYLGIVNSPKRLKERYKEHKGTPTNGGGPTMLALLSMDSAKKTAEIERVVINWAMQKKYQNRCKYQSEQEDSKPMDLTEAWNCVNKNNGGNGVRPSTKHETRFYLYIFYTDKAHAS